MNAKLSQHEFETQLALFVYLAMVGGNMTVEDVIGSCHVQGLRCSYNG